MELLMLIVSVVVSLSVGLFVFARSPREVINRLYGLLTLSFVCLCVANYMTLHPSEHMLTYVRITIAATTVALTLLYLLVVRLQASEVASIRTPANRGLLIFTAIVLLLDISPYVFSGVVEREGGLSPVPAWGVILFICHFILLVLMSLRIVLRGVRASSGATRSRFSYIFVGMVPTVLLAPITSVILPIFFSEAQFIALTPLYIAFFVLMIAYAMIKYQLFDIRLAVVRSVGYVGVIFSLSVIYVLLMYGISFVYVGDDQVEVVSPLSITIALVLGFLFQPVRHFFDRLTNHLFYRDYYSSDDFFARLNRELSATTDLRTLLYEAAMIIQETIKVEQAFFFVRRDNHQHTTVSSAGHRQVTGAIIRQLDEYIHIKGDVPVLVDSVANENPELATLLRERQIALILPLMRGEEVLSYLFLGDQKSGLFSTRDFRVLETISDTLIIAIQNALSVQEVKDLNANLQQRIDDATKELRASNEKLHRLDVAKDEFVSMASHQLRTPLTSVKGYISMVLEGDAGKISDMQAKLLGEAFTSSERMVHLINDFLNVSRLQTGKFMLDRRRVDLAGVVKQEVDSLQTTAKSRNIKLLYRQPSVFPVLYLDEGKLRQVVMNFIDNAFYYSREFSSVTIKVMADGPDVVVTVQDSGMGVPEAEQKSLFTKFFRATNARKQRPDGTGVGLFLAKKVIVSHGGTMIFESVEGKGSTFGFRLPIKKLSLAPADDADQLDN